MSRKLKLGVQGWFLAQPHTGIGQHTKGLLKALKKRHVPLNVVVPQAVKWREAVVLKPKWWLPHPALKKWFWERVQVPAYFAKQDLKWELYPYPCPLPKQSKHKRAVTVHDTILWTDKRYAGGWLKARYHALAQRSLQQVEQVFAVSEWTQSQLQVDSLLLPNAVEVETNLKKRPYEKALVYLGGYDIRKQVPALIKAFEVARQDHPEMELLLVGKPHHVSRYYPALPEVKGVRHLGAMSDKRVYETLKSAFALVHFSDAEGFNLPLLQAMAVGTPVMARDLAVNKEVSAGAALLMDASHKTALSDKIKMLKDPATRRATIAAQSKAARRYSWDKSAKILIKALS